VIPRTNVSRSISPEVVSKQWMKIRPDRRLGVVY
jgi:hypothetical protein